MKGTMALERPKHRNQAKQEVNDGRERVPKRRNASEKALLLSIHKLRGPRRQTASQTPIFSLTVLQTPYLSNMPLNITFEVFV